MKAVELIKKLCEIMEKEKRWAEHTEVTILLNKTTIKRISKVEYNFKYSGDGIILS